VDFLKKIQDKPLHTRKLILWTIVIIVALILTTIWINSSYKQIQELKSQNIIQELNIPKMEMPAINE